MTPIGRIHSPHREAKGTPIQPRWADAVKGTVEVFQEHVPGLRDLEGFDRIWLLYWFDRVTGPQLEVVPYRDTQTRGVFATRAPCRPNPIGLSCVRLLRIEEAVLEVADLDVLDGTPLLDIKPYIPDCDVFSVKRVGWWSCAACQPSADHRFIKREPD